MSGAGGPLLPPGSTLHGTEVRPSSHPGWSQIRQISSGESKGGKKRGVREKGIRKGVLREEGIGKGVLREEGIGKGMLREEEIGKGVLREEGIGKGLRREGEATSCYG